MHLTIGNLYGIKQSIRSALAAVIGALTTGDPESVPEGAHLLQEVQDANILRATITRADYAAAEVVLHIQ